MRWSETVRKEGRRRISLETKVHSGTWCLRGGIIVTFVQEEEGVTTNSTNFLNMEPRYLRRLLKIFGLSNLRPTSKEMKS
jgi:hypothetical protein